MPQIEVTVNIDANVILNVGAGDKSGVPQIEVTVNIDVKGILNDNGGM